jgi:hypothetical protein
MELDLNQRIEGVVSAMGSGGCPCRYPRLRAFVARDTREAGVAALTSEEQPMLIAAYKAAVEVVDGRCVRCWAVTTFWAWEFGETAHVEYLKIDGSALPDLGAPATSPLPRCRPFSVAGFVTKRQKRKVERYYPRLSVDAWLSWLAERAP